MRSRHWQAAAAVLALAVAVPAAAEHAALSDELKTWLQRQGAVRFGPEGDYGPFVYADAGGQVQGLSVDMLHLVQRHTGLQVQVLPPAPLKQHLAALRERRLDLLSSLRPTPERAAFLDFTQPYVTVPAVVVVRQDRVPQAEGGDVLANLAGRRVTVGEGYAVEAPMRQRYPQVQWLAVPDDVQALSKVADGTADAAVADAASVAFVVARHGLQGLHSAGRVGFDYTLSFAVRKDWPELRAVIDRGIQAISADERRTVLERWAPELQAAHNQARAPRATGLALALLVLALGVLVVALARRRHTRARP
jgi:ABC-type amino acid transport substrate-binding protein